MLEEHGVRVSMDGKGRYTDNIFVERLWPFRKGFVATLKLPHAVNCYRFTHVLIPKALIVELNPPDGSGYIREREHLIVSAITIGEDV